MEQRCVSLGKQCWPLRMSYSTDSFDLAELTNRLRMFSGIINSTGGNPNRERVTQFGVFSGSPCFAADIFCELSPNLHISPW